MGYIFNRLWDKIGKLWDIFPFLGRFVSSKLWDIIILLVNYGIYFRLTMGQIFSKLWDIFKFLAYIFGYYFQ